MRKIETIKALAMTICFAGIAITMLDIITPGEKQKKQVRLIYSLIIIITVAAPIVSGKVSLEFPEIKDIESTQAYIEVGQTFQQSLEEYFCENISLALTEKLKIKNINPLEISVGINKDENSCISISEVNIVLAPEDEDKSEQVVMTVRNELGDIQVNIKIAEASNGEENQHSG